MLKMLVVDDDQFEIDGVKYLIAEYQIAVEVWEASSAEEAIKMMEKNKIDILISDIRMSGMDGLQLVEHLKEHGHRCKVIFMSAYGEFEYARKAINLQAIHYILKPVNVEEFLRVVQEVIEQCKLEEQQALLQQKWSQAYTKEMHYMQGKFLAQWITGERSQKQAGETYRIESLLPYDRMRMLLLDSRSKVFDQFDAAMEAALAAIIQREIRIIHLNEFQSLLLFASDEDETKMTMQSLGDRMIDWFRQQADAEVVIVVSGWIQQVEQLEQQYQSLETILQSKFYYDESVVLFADISSFMTNDALQVTNDLLQELLQYLVNKRIAIARMKYEQLFDRLQNDQYYSVAYVKFVCMEILLTISNTFVQHQVLSHHWNDHFDTVYKSEKLSSIRQIISSVLDECEQRNDEGIAEGTNRAVTEVERIIMEQFAADLSLDMLAVQVYLSPSYLSYLFAKQKGISVVQYLTVVRIDHAKQLLATTNKKIGDIAQEVGYTNVAYFGTLFKSHTGKTPTQYREEG